MFVKRISILLGSTPDPRNIAAPRPSDLVSEQLGHAAVRAMQAELKHMSRSERIGEPERYLQLQMQRREQLEAFMWSETNSAATQRMLDLIDQLCAEDSWSADCVGLDDPSRPSIDMQAAETGALLVWLLRRHEKKLSELEPRIVSVVRAQLRRRLLAPITAHEDYPFMSGMGRCPALILSDLLFICLMTEQSPARRQVPIKVLLRLLDRNCALSPDVSAPLRDRLIDACAIADLARLLKRLTRGEMDLTRTHPPIEWLDSVLIPWICEDYFFDPAAGTLRPDIPGIDVFRLGYLAGDRAISALGAQLHRIRQHPSLSVSGRVLSMEYMRAVQDENAAPPKLRRAAMDNGTMLASRLDTLYGALAGVAARGNAGDLAMFLKAQPILAAEGDGPFSLPIIGNYEPLRKAERSVPTQTEFTDDRDLMSVDLTDAYPDECPIAAFQRTLMTLRGDNTMRLVDAFELSGNVASISFRFVAALRPLVLRDCVCIGGVRLSWDGDLLPEVSDLAPSPSAPAGRWLLQFTLHKPGKRTILGFCFEVS